MTHTDDERGLELKVRHHDNLVACADQITSHGSLKKKNNKMIIIEQKEEERMDEEDP